MAGIRADAKKAKEPSDKNPGVAWSHNFLNQKPWHPSNFRNQARVFEAEQQAAQAAKSNAIAKAEFEAEQEKLKQLSYLSAAEQKKFADRQSIAFMYMKPPGYDAAQKKTEQATAKPVEQITGEAGERLQGQEGAREGKGGPGRAGGGGKHVANMLEAMSALHQQDRFEIKHVSGLGRKSPPRGGGEGSAANQQILVGSSDDDAGGADGGGESPQAKRRRLDQAEAFLKAAGISVPEVLAQFPATQLDKGSWQWCGITGEEAASEMLASAHPSACHHLMIHCTCCGVLGTSNRCDDPAIFIGGCVKKFKAVGKSRPCEFVRKQSTRNMPKRSCFCVHGMSSISSPVCKFVEWACFGRPASPFEAADCLPVHCRLDLKQ
ncbi:hypothetical protein WJX84_003607 [Apatococcus fuscideae]|uniref:CBF1-interacting co-repressor CIR N-terminal domain-containing protein n=1 Tax=Apatococcus fuscideae TaxID=2026836 RepID=A0AAW1T6N5_9CHLO